ncbi:MAG: protein tyrosine phosphatase family protein [Chloroflexi bacterium]|nr:protein tyrosine phosphatase family protein [Chloroflexota bacterium]
MLEEIYNYLQLSDILHSGGMPTPEQVSSLAEDGIEVVVNLATPKSESWMPNEQERVEAQNIAYYGIPVDWDNPTRNDLNKFTAIMDKHKGGKILVHCQANYRATVFIALYRYNFLGWTEENAFKDVREIWNPSEYPVWEKFIENSLRAQS